ncbi:putative Ribosome biogenesis protein YTM1 [Paratrimastix pyriformis]|uniref:Ribosome biogenesis protein YTM1 n=1 Tax=Paratrimastix pyriformis TaxID=342808 RepID=A0ABQ8UKU6_9EUKA|nr:putative Ribosome biogenesis protein YTM1 [Paratrimastix pyriformis]
MQDLPSTEPTVNVKFVTKTSSVPPPEGTMAIPLSTTRDNLRDVLRSLTESDATFDFIIANEIIRPGVSLTKILQRKKISEEALVEIEYIESDLAPLEQICECPHRDAVTGVSFCPQFGFVTASFDGSLHLWSEQGALAFSTQAHPMPITDVVATTGGPTRTVVTASKDHTLALWQLSRGTKAFTKQATLMGHTDSVQCCALSPDQQRLASGGWDNAVMLWALQGPTVEAPSPASKAEAEEDTAESGVGRVRPRDAEVDEAGVKRRREGQGKMLHPLVQLRHHRGAVTGLHWEGASAGAGLRGEAPVVPGETLWSASWDHTLLRWDLQAQIHTAELTAPCSALCMAATTTSAPGSATAPAPGNAALLLTGHVDGAARLWDPRTQDGAVSRPFREHTGMVTGVAWSPRSPYHFSTVGTEGLVCLWDIRARKPMQQHRFPLVPPTLSPAVEGVPEVGETTITGMPTNSQKCVALVPNKVHCCCFEERSAPSKKAHAGLIGCGCDNGSLFLFSF